MHELLEFRDRVGRLKEHRVAHELGEIVARVFQLIEGNPDTPDVNVRVGGQDFFTKGFGSAVEGTVVLPEGEIGSVLLGES